MSLEGGDVLLTDPASGGYVLTPKGDYRSQAGA